MKIRLTTDRFDRGAMQYDGEVIDLPDLEGKRLVEVGQAEPVAELPAAAAVNKPAKRR